jgi:hypothetical protein
MDIEMDDARPMAAFNECNYVTHQQSRSSVGAFRT